MFLLGGGGEHEDPAHKNTELDGVAVRGVFSGVHVFDQEGGGASAVVLW